MSLAPVLVHGCRTSLPSVSRRAAFLLGFWLFALGVCQAQDETRWALVIHGGAGGLVDAGDSEINQRRRASLEEAARRGSEILAEGGTALEAVETVIRHLEDEVAFNAGVGAVMNAAGIHELDASIMDGDTLRCGAVAGVTRVRHPISAARIVMNETRHVLMQGAGAERVAGEAGLEMVDNTFFTAPSMIPLRDRLRAGKEAEQENDHKGTVGCVALDRAGRIAAGTSTGGLPGKLPGRVGDSPVIGAGTYANSATCGVSCTGTGEEYIRHAAAHSVSMLLESRDMSLEEAVSNVLRERLKPGDGGMIAIDYRGEIRADFTTDSMAWAAAASDGRFEVHVGESRGEDGADSSR